ncbi:MAG: glycosyltransferase family 9 protein [Planctomycetota bacterium]
MSANEDIHILLIRLSAIGDVVHALHALAALRAARPAATIGFLVEDKAASLIEGHPDIDRLHVYPRKAWTGDLLSSPARVGGEVAAFLAGLSNARYDVAVDLQGNLKGGVLSLLSRAPRRIGLAKGSGIEGSHVFATEHVTTPPPPFHRVDRAIALVGPLGVDGGGGEFRLGFTPEECRATDRFTAEQDLADGSFAVLHPGTSRFGLHKRWPADRYGALARALSETHGLRSVVTFGPGEEDLVAAATENSGGAAVAGPASASLKTLARLIERSALFVAGDTGALHLAAYLGVPTVGLFGPKDPKIYAPRGPRTAVVWLGHDCSGCPKRSCPDPVCMTEITPDHVLSAVREVLEGHPAPAGVTRGN